VNPHPIRKSLPHEIPHWIDPSSEVYFVTINCRDRGLNSLCVADVAEALLESVEHRHVSREWYVHLFLLMHDHLHALLSFSPDLRRIQQSLTNWKSWTAKRAGVRWQRDFFEHRLRGDEGFSEKADYIRNNPVRAGLIKVAEDWPWVVWADANEVGLLRGPTR
jgi:REP element-mobilizing transposase RayT